MLQPLVEVCNLEPATLLADITRWYNGYRFAPATDTVYNANMVLYFVKNFRRKDCAYPKPMLDENIASDYGKILGMFSIGNRDNNFAVLDELITNGEVTAQQRRKFDFEKGFERDDFISLLAYMGFVSLQRKTLAGEVFSIPNYVMRELYFQYFKVELERRNQMTISNRAIALAVEVLALQDDIQPLITEMERALQLLSNRDAMGMDEKHVKVLLLTLLYQTSVYFIQSEREMNRKYPDIMLLERSPIVVDHQHLIELKYSKQSDGEAGWASQTPSRYYPSARVFAVARYCRIAQAQCVAADQRRGARGSGEGGLNRLNSWFDKTITNAYIHWCHFVTEIMDAMPAVMPKNERVTARISEEVKLLLTQRTSSPCNAEPVSGAGCTGKSTAHD